MKTTIHKRISRIQWWLLGGIENPQLYRTRISENHRWLYYRMTQKRNPK